MNKDVIVKRCPDCDSDNISQISEVHSDLDISPSTIISIILLAIGIIITVYTFMAIPALTNGGTIIDFFQSDYWWILFIPAGIFIVPAVIIIAYKSEV